jgi:hypothetical protein
MWVQLPITRVFVPYSRDHTIRIDDPQQERVGTTCVAWSVASRFDVGPALFLQFHHAHDA